MSRKKTTNQTESAVATKKRKAKAKQQRRKFRKRGGDRLSTFDVCQLVQAKSISSRLQLVSLAAAQVREGKTTLAEFIGNGGSKAVDEAIQLAKEFAKARLEKAALNCYKRSSLASALTVVKENGLQLLNIYSSATRSTSLHFVMPFTMHWKKVEGSIAMFIYMVLRIAGNRLLYRH